MGTGFAVDGEDLIAGYVQFCVVNSLSFLFFIRSSVLCWVLTVQSLLQYIPGRFLSPEPEGKAVTREHVEMQGSEMQRCSCGVCFQQTSAVNSTGHMHTVRPTLSSVSSVFGLGLI